MEDIEGYRDLAEWILIRSIESYLKPVVKPKNATKNQMIKYQNDLDEKESAENFIKSKAFINYFDAIAPSADPYAVQSYILSGKLTFEQFKMNVSKVKAEEAEKERRRKDY